MSTYTALLCTGFKLTSAEKSIKEIEKLITKHMDDYAVAIVLEDHNGRYCLDMDASDVGDSFSDRVGALVSSMSPFVIDCFCVTVREDSMSDDRDQDFIGGPSDASIEGFRSKLAIEKAIQILSGAGTRAEQAREALQKLFSSESESVNQLVNPKDITVIVDITGGVLQGVVGTHPINLTCLDYDIEGSNQNQIFTRGDGTQVVASERIVDVDPAYCQILSEELNGPNEADKSGHRIEAQQG